MLKKGAMFGLDARIALAIFGALSVISGAALYSAIQTAKAEQLRQYFVELSKASEQYYLDNAKQLELYPTANQDLYITDLSRNRESLSTWNGPYWQTDLTGNIIRDSFTNSIHSDVYSIMYLRQASDWSAMGTSTDEHCVAGSSDCSEWIGLAAYTSGRTSSIQGLFNILDELVDGSDGALVGSVRYGTYANGIVFYKSIPRKR